MLIKPMAYYHAIYTVHTKFHLNLMKFLVTGHWTETQDWVCEQFVNKKSLANAKGNAR